MPNTDQLQWQTKKSGKRMMEAIATRKDVEQAVALYSQNVSQFRLALMSHVPVPVQKARVA